MFVTEGTKALSNVLVLLTFKSFQVIEGSISTIFLLKSGI